MIHVITCISYDADLLPHFVEYYRSLGIDSFIVAVDERSEGILARTQEIAATLPARIQIVPASERQRLTGLEGNNKEETRARFIAPEDWIIPADLDEFIRFPAPVADLVQEMIEADATFIMGYFVDRTAVNGILAQTERTPSIWEQYPLEGPVSELLVACWCHKIILCRGDCELSSGHHNVIRPTRPLFSRQGTIYHFKWRAGILEAVKRRLDLYKKAGIGPYTDSERIIEYFEKNGRLIPSDFSLRDGWRPGHPAAESTSTIFTAITGNYDTLKDPPTRFVAGSDLVAFMDHPQPSRFWNVRPIHQEFTDPARNAKIHKILPHLYFPNAKYSLWLDGSVRVKTQITVKELADLYLKDADVAVFYHRTRFCIYQEADACLKAAKDNPGTIRHQMGIYKYENYPEESGLAECSVILRRHSDHVRYFNEIWWNEIQNHSKRDQLSFNYVVWKVRVRLAFFPGNLAANDLFERHPHCQETSVATHRENGTGEAHQARQDGDVPAASKELRGLGKLRTIFSRR